MRAQVLDSPLWTHDSCWAPPPAQVLPRLHTSQGDTSSFLSRWMQAADGTGTHSQKIYSWALRSARFAGGWVGSAQRLSASSPCGFVGTGKKWMAPLTSESFGYWTPRERTRILLFLQRKQTGLKCGRHCSLGWGCEAGRQTRS